MIIKPSEHPGSHERHLLRKASNPLFPNAPTLDDDNLIDAQRLDHEALQTFNTEFRALLEKTTSLTGNVESEVILQLKDRLDRAYETASSIGGNTTAMKGAIRKLLGFMMASVRRGAGNDAHAHLELDQEETAREAHFALLDASLVADLLHPESPIHPDELVPTLLSADKDELQLALQMFDEVQLLAILSQGAALLEQLQGEGVNVSLPQEKLAFIQGYAEFAGGLSP
ncbi:hypothetical protein SAMN05660964_02907 [Thiothrix caldifontis]|uniref:Uncharacterized protein n=1 Tax=Thiothrix caldifontis TaxID=525918 RepID=A0A1H4FAU8_9GAMM|nr:hypothetical protein [Thiothrix caldifontis]SEA94443.1 hypothetical protein SAMN05660964_02907 [Thiothrix caldifontis]